MELDQNVLEIMLYLISAIVGALVSKYFYRKGYRDCWEFVSKNYTVLEAKKCHLKK